MTSAVMRAGIPAKRLAKSRLTHKPYLLLSQPVSILLYLLGAIVNKTTHSK